MNDSSPFLSPLLITGLTAFVPLFATRLRRLRMPIVVGEILAGILPLTVAKQSRSRL